MLTLSSVQLLYMYSFLLHLMYQIKPKLFVLCIKNKQFISENSVPQFYGDESLFVFFERFCNSEPSNGGKSELILVENLNIFYNNKMQTPQTSEKFYSKISCNFVYYHNVTFDDLNTQISTNLKFKKLQFIFNLKSFYFENNIKFFNYTLVSLSTLYYKCQNCLPFIVTFNHQLTFEKLTSWAAISVNYVTDFFQAVLLSSSKDSLKLPDVIHLSPTLNGCHLRTKHLFVPKNSKNFASLKTHFSQCNFNQAVKNVSVNSDFPYCLLNIDKNSKKISTYYSIDIELLKVMMSKYNFSVNYIDAQSSWGALDENGSWVGVIGHILTGRSNMAICEVSRTNERIKVVDFTTHTFLDQMVFMSQSPSKQHRDFFLTNQLSVDVKLCQLVSYLLILASLMIVYKVHFQKMKNKIKIKSPYYLQQSNLPTKLLAAFLKQRMYFLFFIFYYKIFNFSCKLDNQKQTIINTNSFCSLSFCFFNSFQRLQFTFLLSNHRAYF